MARNEDSQPAADRSVDPASVTAHLPNTPDRIARPSVGEALQRAQQMAERGIQTGAVDAPGVDATTGELPGEAVIRAEAQLSHARVAGEIAESEASGLTIAESARRGAQVPPAAGALTTSVEGLRAEHARATQDIDESAEENRDHRLMLRGEMPAPDGTHRPGNPIAPDARDLRREVRRQTLRDALPVVIPLLVEGGAVTFNMHTYLRADDGNWLLPLVIAVITVGILTFAPYLLGLTLNDVAQGRSLSLVERVVLGVLAGFWITVGVTLALVRVQVDQAEAVRAAEERYRSDVELAQQLGTPVEDIPPVDPSTVFDPVLPTVFWIAVFLGFGVALIWWERMHRNPIRMQELRSRLRLTEAKDRGLLLAAQLDDVEHSVALQRQINGLATQMWGDEHEVIDATAEVARSVYHETLGEASGDPSMPIAIERHRAAQAAKAADDAAAATAAEEPADGEGGER